MSRHTSACSTADERGGSNRCHQSGNLVRCGGGHSLVEGGRRTGRDAPGRQFQSEGAACVRSRGGKRR